MLNHARAEQEFTSKLAKDFIEEGFRPLNPHLIRNELPAGYVPDLVLKRGEEILIIEIKSSVEHRTLEEVSQLKQIVESKPNWKFKMFVMPDRKAASVPEDNLEDIKKLLSRAKQLNRSGELEAASVILWMVIEVALRTLLTNRQSRPNLGVSGMSMARSLLDFGELDEDELRLIDRAWRTRNLSVHGFRLTPREPITPELISFAEGLAERAKTETISTG